jgi:hypothetical protein
VRPLFSVIPTEAGRFFLRTVCSCAACGAEGPRQYCSLTDVDETQAFAGCSTLSEKHRRRNMKPFAQFLDVRFIKLTLPMQDFRNDAFRTKDGRQIFLTKVMGIH